MIVTTTLLFISLLLDVVTGSSEGSDSYVKKEAERSESEHHSYVQDAQAGLSHMLDELKAFQKRIEHSVLHTEKGAFIVAGVLCSIAMVVLIAGALYFHWFGNYVPKYVRVVRKDGQLVTEDVTHSHSNGRLKSE